jgi:nucleobindin
MYCPKDEEEHQQKAKLVVDTVFEAIDKDKDGKTTLEKFEAAGLHVLPSFENLGAKGHHYNVESGAYPTSLLLTLSL